MVCVLFCFFFKQKTAYEMRISDWSSDVCSSDLLHTRVPVDVIALHDPTFQEPWWLIVPPDSELVLPTALVVTLYRERMQVEHTFRDFKTHLGLREIGRASCRESVWKYV